ncbi:MAG: RNA ligase family protein [Sarcina sp.]
MKEIKKYTDVIRYGKSSTQGVIKEGDIISITEKVDGANASFTRDFLSPTGISCYSRRLLLDEHNTLQGFYGWVNDNIAVKKYDLFPNFRYIGEWTCPHKIQYKEEYTKTFLLFSIWDEDSEQYLSDEIVRSEAERLDLQTVEYFYYGEFISYEHMSSFIGKSNITKEPDTGEGIVVKNVDYRDKYGNQCFVKLVSEKFAEVQKQRLPKNPNVYDKDLELIKSILTKPRVDKLMHKLVDENLLQRDQFCIENMGLLLKLLGNAVIDDMIKEESDCLNNIEDKQLRRTVGKILPLVIKDVLKDYE